MCSRNYKIYDESYPYFITTNIRFGLPVLSDPEAAEIILENLVFLRSERSVKIFAYVLMENHIHGIFKGKNLTTKIARFKSYSARRIVDSFKDRKRTRWLKQLRKVKLNNKIDRNYQLWEEGFHPKKVVGDGMLIQKIEYIHQNPVKRGYVDKPSHWRYSSARNYNGSEGLIPIDSYS